MCVRERERERGREREREIEEKSSWLCHYWYVIVVDVIPLLTTIDDIHFFFLLKFSRIELRFCCGRLSNFNFFFLIFQLKTFLIKDSPNRFPLWFITIFLPSWDCVTTTVWTHHQCMKIEFRWPLHRTVLHWTHPGSGTLQNSSCFATLLPSHRPFKYDKQDMLDTAGQETTNS